MAGFFTGQPEQTKQFQRFTPQQQGVQNQTLQQAMQMLQQQGQGNQFDFAPIEKQAREGFNQQTIPGIAERFSALNAQGSSGFKQALGQAGAGLETNLAALRSQYGLQQQGMQQNQLNSLLGYGLQPSFESQYQPETFGFLGGLGQGIAPSAGYTLPMLLSGLLGGGSGGALASGAGNILGSLGGYGASAAGLAASNPAIAAGGAGLGALAALAYYLNNRS